MGDGAGGVKENEKKGKKGEGTGGGSGGAGCGQPVVKAGKKASNVETT